MSVVKKFWKPVAMTALSGLVAILSACQPAKPIELAGDFDRDGVADRVVYKPEAHTFYFAKGLKDNVFAPETALFSADKRSKVTLVVAEDSNADGKLDVRFKTEKASAVPGLRVPFYEMKTYVALNNGNGTFQDPTEVKEQK